MIQWYVYILSDDYPRYVGFSREPNKRFKRHLIDKKNSHKASWLKSLSRDSRIPTLHIIEEGLTKEKASELEIFYISYFKYLGCKLVNLTDGGESGNGWGHINSKPRTTKHKINIGLALKNKPKSQSHKDKLSKSREKPVVGQHIETKEIVSFLSPSQAALALGKSKENGSFIAKVCKGRQESAYGYIWRYK